MTSTPKSLVWDVRKEEQEPLVSLGHLAARFGKSTGIDDARVRYAIATTLYEVSEAAGEGALLVAVGNDNLQDIVKRTCMEMDRPGSRMAWRSNKQLRWVDRTLLRAMLILDGATVIQPDANGGTIVRPRLVVYPFTICTKHPSKGFSVISWTPPDSVDGCTCPRPEESVLVDIRKKLVGKGSRKHGGANIAVLLQHANGDSSVVSVSADGPIEKWP